MVVAAEGYPASPVRGDRIDGIDTAGHVPGSYVLQAGTATDGAGHLVTSGGRVLNIVGSGPDLAAARASAYQAAELIRLRGGWYRSDIADGTPHRRGRSLTDAGPRRASRRRRQGGCGRIEQ